MCVVSVMPLFTRWLDDGKNNHDITYKKSAFTDWMWVTEEQQLLEKARLIIHTHTRLTALCPGLPGWASSRKVIPIWILLKQETVSGSGISWAICKSAPRSRQITMPAPHHSVFYRLDALPAVQPTASKYWRHKALKAQTNHPKNIKSKPQQ